MLRSYDFLCLSREVYWLLKMAASAMIPRGVTNVGQKALSQNAEWQMI